MDDEMAAQLKNFACAGKKILGAGLNYKALLASSKQEMPSVPIIFMKPSTSYITEGQQIIIPKSFTVNQEIELGVIIGTGGKNIDECNAMDFVGGYCVALDLTATSELGPARAKGQPWTIGKSFDTACPVGKFIPKSAVRDPHNLELWCTINGKMVQCSNTNDLIFNVPQLISYVSKFMTLEPNDLILTGTPAGAGPIKSGDVIDGGFKDVGQIQFRVVNES